LSSKFQGYAYTFITEDQARYAGDIIKALELSGTAIPTDLEKLWADFKDQQKAVSNSFFCSGIWTGFNVHARESSCTVYTRVVSLASLRTHMDASVSVQVFSRLGSLMSLTGHFLRI